MTTRQPLTRLIALALLLLAAAGAVAVRAQVDAQYTQYFNTQTYYDPAAAGNLDAIHITLGGRAQWVGIHHAPTAFMASADMPFKLLNKRWGTGVVVTQQSMGLYSGTNVGAQLAYKFKLLKGTFSAGLQIGLVNEKFEGSKVDIPDGDDAHDSGDDAIPQTDVTGNAFDLGLGVFYQHKWFWAGLAATHLTEPTVNLKTEGDEENLYEFKQGRIYYFMAGSNIPIKNTLFELQPSVFVKTDATFFQGEATLRMRYNKFITAGVGYRYKDAVSVMIGAEYKGFTLGYAYDYPVSNISKATNGSHEVFLNYNVKLNMNEKNKNKHKSIRLM